VFGKTWQVESRMGEEHGGALGKERVEKRLQELMESGVQDK
jgi:hypothetical protein